MARLGVHRWPVTVGGACAVVLLIGAVVGAVTGGGGAEEAEPAPPVGAGSVVVAPPPSFGGPPPADVVRFGMVGLEHLDPAFVLPSDQPAMIAVDLLFDGLTAPGPDGGEPVPALAESWEPDETLRTWTFRLREGATFADGSPVTAFDVQRTFDRLAELGNISLAGVRLDVVEGYGEVAAGSADSLSGIGVVDERTLRIITTESYASLPDLLSSPLYGIVPNGVVTADPAGFDVAPVGSGPYRLEARDGAVVRLAARDGADVPAPTAELIAYPDAAGAYAAFEAGELDWGVVPAGLLEEAVAAHGEGAVVPFGVELLYGFNLDHPSFVDVRFRSGVAKAIDRQRLLDTVLESGRALDGVVPPGVPGAVGDACGALCSFDPLTAAALVDQAFPDGAPTIELDVYDDPVELAVAESVAADLEAAGVPVEVVATPFEEYQQNLVGGGAQLFTYGWVGVAIEPDVYVAPMFLSGSQDNVTGFEDGIVDLAVRTARAEPDRAARLEQYGAIDRQIMLGLPVVPVAGYVTAAVVGERVSGYQGRVDGTFVVPAMQVEGQR